MKHEMAACIVKDTITNISADSLSEQNNVLNSEFPTVLMIHWEMSQLSNSAGILLLLIIWE
jgi:hypothetical protein